MRVLRLWLMALAYLGAVLSAQAQSDESRIALVIGQGAYVRGTLPTAVNDAGLIAQTLTDSGFEVLEGRDLDSDGIRQTIRSFLDRVEEAGPGADVVIYLAGYTAQLEGDNFLLPVDFKGMRESDIAMDGFRLSDLVRSLSALRASSNIVVIDAPFQFPGLDRQEIAPGLAYVDPPNGFLIAYSDAPGRAAPLSDYPGAKGKGAYGIYASDLVQAMREPGLVADEVFKRVRAWVHEDTQGKWTPWHSTASSQSFVFFPLAEGERLPVARRPSAPSSVEAAYAYAIETDTIAAYQEFLRIYPNDSLSPRVKALLADRREALFWRKTVGRNSAEAYWTYLKSYSRGPHAEDARRRLAILSRPVIPPSNFTYVVYDDLPPPLPIEIEYEETYIYNDYRTYYSYAPPPVFPGPYLPSRPIRDWRPPPPPPPPGIGILPVPAPLPFPERARAPREFLPRIVPVTPHGAVAVPVRPPAISGRPIEGMAPGRRILPPDAMRPFNPGGREAREQPGLLGPVVPIPRGEIRRPTGRPGPAPEMRPVGRPGPAPGPAPEMRPMGRPGPAPGPAPEMRPMGRPGPAPGPAPEMRPVGRPGAAPGPVPGQRRCIQPDGQPCP